MKRLLLLAATTALSGCLGSVTNPVDNPSDPATETFASSLNINISQMQKTTDGVYYKDVTVGTGATLTSPVNVTITYAGFLKTGALFDQGANVTFSLQSAVFGFQEGMLGMKVGGERVMVIPSALGYGPTVVNLTTGTIPANSTLIFDVKLLDLP